MSGKFTVLVVDGEAADLGDPETNFLRFEGFSWEETVELVRMGFTQGFQVVIWMRDEIVDGGIEACGTA